MSIFDPVGRLIRSEGAVRDAVAQYEGALKMPSGKWPRAGQPGRLADQIKAQKPCRRTRNLITFQRSLFKGTILTERLTPRSLYAAQQGLFHPLPNCQLVKTLRVLAGGRLLYHVRCMPKKEADRARWPKQLNFLRYSRWLWEPDST
jgi:hypothetical protein